MGGRVCGSVFKLDLNFAKVLNALRKGDIHSQTSALASEIKAA
jgi:hypothetical protein